MVFINIVTGANINQLITGGPPNLLMKTTARYLSVKHHFCVETKTCHDNCQHLSSIVGLGIDAGRGKRVELEHIYVMLYILVYVHVYN